MMKKIKYLLFLLLFIGCGKSVPNISFDENQAYLFLTEQCDIGPRNPGSEGIDILRDYIKNTLEQCGAVIKTQNFSVTDTGETYYGTNIAGSFYPRNPRRLLIGAHYDTRPWADKDKDEKNHNEPIMGANDGASGVAILLELANILADNQPARYGVDLAFFDLEDMGKYNDSESWSRGAQYYAKNMLTDKPEYVIVVDMIGDDDLHIPMEYYSYHSAPELLKKIVDFAEARGFDQFSRKVGIPIVDDHLPFLKEGLKAIDLIDFDYSYWHTMYDTPDKCSPKSLKAVGQTLVDLIYEKK